MNIFAKILFSFFALCNVLPIYAEVDSYPDMQFYTTFDSKSLYQKLKDIPKFDKLNEENYGSPILLTVYYNVEKTAGGQAAAMTSAILSGSTLGLIPIVTNNDLVITYAIKVHGTVVSEFEFRKNLTQATNIWVNQRQGVLNNEAMEWVLSTTKEFVEKLSNDSKFGALVSEYDFYFGQS